VRRDKALHSLQIHLHAPYTRIGDNPTQNTPTEPLFRTCLKEIADLYVQTITYRLFAACTRSRDTFTHKTAFDITPPTIGIIRDVFPFIRAAQPTRRMEVMIDDTASIVNAADWKLSSNNTSTKEREKTRSFTFTRPSSPSTLLRPYPLYLPDFGGGEGVAVNVTSVTLTCLCFFGSIYTRRCYRTAGVLA
jgi:hypothetical protein